MHEETTASIESRLRELGLVLPDPPCAAGAYVGVVVRNGIGAVSGQFPFMNVLGEQLGAHTRTVSAVDRLPFDAPLELAAVFATRSALSSSVVLASRAG